MLIPISTITVEGVPCNTANISVAVSSSTAIRVVPTDAAGNEYPDAAMGIVGDSSQADIATFMDAVAAAATVLVAGRGI